MNRPRYIISKEFHFSASHQLDHLVSEQPNHPCARLHGHNYVVRIFLSADGLDKNGFVLDYNEIRWFQQLLDEQYDHRHLNQVQGSSIHTTAESLARHFGSIFTQHLTSKNLHNRIEIIAVEVQETPKTCARWER